MDNIRRTEILIDGKWKQINFENIRAGDIFRLFEPTGETVVDDKGNDKFIAKTNAYLNKDGVYGVEVIAWRGDGSSR
jgi:hypothetical protein